MSGRTIGGEESLLRYEGYTIFLIINGTFTHLGKIILMMSMRILFEIMILRIKPKAR